MGFNHVMNNNKLTNDADSEDDFPIRQVPYDNQDNQDNQAISNEAVEAPRVPFSFPTQNMTSAPSTMGGMGMKLGGMSMMGQQLPRTNMSGMTMGGQLNTSNKPMSFGNCCGPPRPMGIMGPMGQNNPMGPINPLCPPMLPGQRKPPSYQDVTQNNRHASHINEIYGKLAEARKKIAELNKFIDEIYETLPKIQ